MGGAPNFSFLGNYNNTTPFPGGVPVDFNWIFGAQNVDVIDKETWAKLDGDLPDAGQRRLDGPEVRRAPDLARAASPTVPSRRVRPAATSPIRPRTIRPRWSNYPSDFNTFGGNIPTGIWYWTPAQLAAYNGPGLVNRDPVAREYYQYLFGLNEKNSAAYVQADFKGERWAGNIGVRYVQHQGVCHSPTRQVARHLPGRHHDLGVRAVRGHPGGPHLQRRAAERQPQVRPDPRPGRALRGRRDHDPRRTTRRSGRLYRPDAAGQRRWDRQRLGRQSGPEAHPVHELRCGPGVVLPAQGAAVSHALLHGPGELHRLTAARLSTTSPSAVSSRPKARWCLTCSPCRSMPRVVSRASRSPTSSSSSSTSASMPTTPTPTASRPQGVVNNDDRLVGTSKNTYNVSGYFENTHFSARVSYNYRSAFYSGLDRNTAFSQDSIGTLAASLAWTFNDNFSVNSRWPEPEQPDPQVLRAGHHAAARVLPQRTAVLPHPAREVLSISGRHGGRSRAAASPARRGASPRTLVPRLPCALGAPAAGRVTFRQGRTSCRRLIDGDTHDDRDSFQLFLWAGHPA